MPLTTVQALFNIKSYATSSRLASYYISVDNIINCNALKFLFTTIFGLIFQSSSTKVSTGQATVSIIILLRNSSFFKSVKKTSSKLFYIFIKFEIHVCYILENRS